MKHVLYTDKDQDAPDSICEQLGPDVKGQVVLGMCRNCHLAEIELDWFPDCPGSPEEAKKQMVEFEALRAAHPPAVAHARVVDKTIVHKTAKGVEMTIQLDANGLSIDVGGSFLTVVVDDGHTSGRLRTLVFDEHSNIVSETPL